MRLPYCSKTNNNHLHLLGQTAVLSGTNYVSGSGFCFGDQQLKEGTPFLSCTSSGFPGEVTAYTIRWLVDGGSALTEAQVQGMYPVIAVLTSQGASQLNILNVTSLGVSSIACRISGEDSEGRRVLEPVISTSENIFVVSGRQTAQYFIACYLFVCIHNS